MSLGEHVAYIGEPETSGRRISQPLRITVDDQPHYPPEVVDAVGVEKLHLPSLGLRWESAHEYEFGSVGNERFPRMRLHIHRILSIIT